MRAECQDIFMIRTPNLSIEYFEKYEHQELDIYEFIHQEKELDLFFRKALLIASPSLYKSYINKPADEKKYKNLNESLLKYFLRSIGRTTPYGYFASVSLGKFGDRTELQRGKQILDLRVDNNWINLVVNMLEGQKEIQNKLKVRYNSLCYRSGDRVNNPYFTSHGKAEATKQIITEKSIRHTLLVDLVKSVASDFVCLTELSDKIKSVYNEIPEEVIIRTLLDMLKNEFLISNLRIPSYCTDTLEYVIRKLKEMKYSGEILFVLEQIRDLLSEFREKEDEKILIEIYNKMGMVEKSKNYLILNVGNRYLNNTVNRSIKDKIEKLSEVLYKIPVAFDSTHVLKEKIIELYGTNVEVPLTKIIDSNGLNGGDYIDLTRIQGTSEDEILYIIDTKVQQAMLNQKEEVQLFAEDFQTVQYEPVAVGSFDINLLITEKAGEYELWLGPNYGSNRAGSMAQRFSECFSVSEFEEYNQLYAKDSSIHEQYEIVEIREFPIYGVQGNIINTKRNCNYYMTLGGFSEEKEREITIDDIFIGLDDRCKMYVYSKRLKRRLRFVTDNMLNPMLNNKISKLLLGISRDYVSHPLNRLTILSSKLHYKHLPRIIIEGVVVVPRMWLLDTGDISGNSYEKFKSDLKKCRKSYRMDSIVYCVSADNRIMVNLDKDEYLRILYNELKRKKRLEFCEMETSLIDGAMVYDDRKRSYVNECVFSVLDAEKGKTVSKSEISNLILCEDGRRKTLCEDGWVFFKLYGTGYRDNEIITIQLPELMEELDNVPHFFLRYSDERGRHLRIRIKFKDDQEAYKQLVKINGWLNRLMELELISDVSFDTYFREINRYGGKEIIDSCEQIFFEDSLVVEKILRCNNLDREEDLEKIYMIGISFILKNLTWDLEDMFSVIDVNVFQNKYRQLYRERHEQYDQYIQAVLAEEEDKYLNIKEEHLQEKKALNIFADKLRVQIEVGKNTNRKENIILSIVHMYCNRITGNRAYEEKYIELVRNTLYHILQRKKHHNKKG